MEAIPLSLATHACRRVFQLGKLPRPPRTTGASLISRAQRFLAQPCRNAARSSPRSKRRHRIRYARLLGSRDERL